MWGNRPRDRTDDSLVYWWTERTADHTSNIGNLHLGWTYEVFFCFCFFFPGGKVREWQWQREVQISSWFWFLIELVALTVARVDWINVSSCLHLQYMLAMKFSVLQMQLYLCGGGRTGRGCLFFNMYLPSNWSILDHWWMSSIDLSSTNAFETKHRNWWDTTVSNSQLGKECLLSNLVTGQ